MATINAAAAWSDKLCREKSLSWIPDFGNEASPPGLDGTRQYRNSNGGGLWRARFNGEQLRHKRRGPLADDQVLAWFAQEAVLQGGKTPVDVPLLLCAYVPRADAAATVIATIGATLAGAVSGRVVLTHSGDLVAGMHFSVFDATTYGWRLHRIYSVAAVGGHATWRDIVFWPRLRFTIADATTLEFDHPKCVMRLAASDSMDLELSMRVRGEPSAEFVEAF
jgi:hypothetical protein